MKFNSMPRIGSRVRWLLSETLVVVLGVLIALALNDYWTDRQERVLELQYLKRIQEDVRTDAEVINLWFGAGLQKKMQALDAIAPFVRGMETMPGDAQNFLSDVVTGGYGGTSATRWVTSTTIEDLKSTGNLRLIRDVDLRRNIARYYHDMEMLFIRIRDRRTGYTAFVFSQLPVTLNDDGAEELDLPALAMIDIDRAVERLRSVEFQALLTQEKNLALFRKQISNSQSKRLAKDLEDYIQQLDGGAK